MPGPTKRSRQNRARRDQKILDDNSPFKGLTVGEMEDMPPAKKTKTVKKCRQNETEKRKRTKDA